MGIKSIGKVSFDAIYDAHADEIYQIALYYSCNHHAAEEIMQSVFMKLYVNLENINPKTIPDWLKVTTRNMSLNYNRDHKKEYPNENIIEIYDEKTRPESLEDEFMNKLRQKEHRELAESIFEQLYRENKRWYEAVTITYCLGKPQKEVAENMGISLKALQDMLYRAKKWIRKHYEEEYDHLDEA